MPTSANYGAKRRKIQVARHSKPKRRRAGAGWSREIVAPADQGLCLRRAPNACMREAAPLKLRRQRLQVSWQPKTVLRDATPTIHIACSGDLPRCGEGCQCPVPAHFGRTGLEARPYPLVRRLRLRTGRRWREDEQKQEAQQE